jgi:hypothetical protein
MYARKDNASAEPARLDHEFSESTLLDPEFSDLTRPRTYSTSPPSYLASTLDQVPVARIVKAPMPTTSRNNRAPAPGSTAAPDNTNDRYFYHLHHEWDHARDLERMIETQRLQIWKRNFVLCVFIIVACVFVVLLVGCAFFKLLTHSSGMS